MSSAASSTAVAGTARGPVRFAWFQLSIYLGLHVACLAVFLVGWSVTAVAVFPVVVLLQGFGITAFYHRYFAHHAFKTSRWFQLVGALLGCMALQRDPLWWVSQHRRHHRHSDRQNDAHSPRQHGMLWSHMFWFMACENCVTEKQLVRDLWKYPELRFLNRLPFLMPTALAVGMYAAGAGLPGLGVTGWQLLVWGWLVPTMVTSHITYCVNSLGHAFGAQAFATGDDSRNSFLLAVATLGEGWHNNHHRYPRSARHGFFWWQIDATYLLLALLARLGLVWDLRPVPAHVLDAAEK